MTAPAASGIFKQVRYGVESAWNTAPSSGGTSYQLRRVSSSLSPDIAAFRSNEIQPDRQVHTFRHGTQMVRGALRGELSPLTFKDFFGALWGGTWAGGTSDAIDASTRGLTWGAGPPGTLTGASGSFISDGFKIGDVVRSSGSSVTANNARNLRITGLTALAMTFGASENEVIAAGSDDTGTVTIAVVGDKLTSPNPATGGTIEDPSFTIEHFFSDQAVYELYSGLKPTTARLNFAPNSLCTVDFDLVGGSFTTGATSYFSAPDDVTTTDATVGVSGVLRMAGTDIATVTGMSMNISGGHTTDPVIGSVFVPFVFPGILDVSGSMTCYFKDQTFLNAAINETNTDLLLYLTLNDAINADFIMLHAHNVLLNTNQKDDGPKAIMQSINFQCKKYLTGGDGTAYDDSTIIMQDSMGAGTP
jgi:hypothetical protein